MDRLRYSVPIGLIAAVITILSFVTGREWIGEYFESSRRSSEQPTHKDVSDMAHAALLAAADCAGLKVTRTETLTRARNSGFLSVKPGEVVKLWAFDNRSRRYTSHLLAAELDDASEELNAQMKYRNSVPYCITSGAGHEDEIAGAVEHILLVNRGAEDVLVRVCAAFDHEQAEDDCERFIGLNLDFYHPHN